MYVMNTTMRDWLRSANTDDDASIVQIVSAVEEQVHAFTGRPSFALAGSATARTFAADDYRLLRVHDIGSMTDLVVKVDEDGDGTFEVTLTSSEYQTEPANALARGKAIERLRIRSTSSRVWPISGGDRLVEVTARWGWPTVPDRVRQAVTIQAARLFKRADAPFGVVTSPDYGGGERLLAKLDPDVEMLLVSLQRNRGGIPT